jgi:replicative DNA helicase
MNNLELGKLPPQAIGLEEAVIGGLLLESDSFLEICDILKANSFYKDSHQKIYLAIQRIFTNNNPIDMLTVMESLRQSKELDEVGGPAYLAQLSGRVGSASHIEFHARIIQQKFIQRELIRVSSEIQNRAFDDSIDVNELIDYSETELFNVQQGNVKNEPVIIGDIGKVELNNLEEISKSDKEFIGIPSGMTALDRRMNGFNKKKLIIIAARPAMGKTTLMVSISKTQALEFNKSVAVFSLEMGRDELWYKYICDDTGITYARLINGDLNSDEWAAIEYAQSKLEQSNLYIDDTPGITLMELRAKCRRLKMKRGIDIIYIDYLQLMQGNRERNGNREQEVSAISRGLKLISKELDIPVVCFSQLNRGVELRPDKKPQLSDLRESGAIEQDADIVAFIHRPEYYGHDQYDNGESTVNKVDIIISKNRAGLTGDISLNRTSNFSKIYDEEIIYIPPLEDNNDLEVNTDF